MRAAILLLAFLSSGCGDRQESKIALLSRELFAADIVCNKDPQYDTRAGKTFVDAVEQLKGMKASDVRKVEEEMLQLERRKYAGWWRFGSPSRDLTSDTMAMDKLYIIHRYYFALRALKNWNDVRGYGFIEWQYLERWEASRRGSDGDLRNNKEVTCIYPWFEMPNGNLVLVDKPGGAVFFGPAYRHPLEEFDYFLQRFGLRFPPSAL